MRLLMILIASLSVSGCAIEIAETNPHPNTPFTTTAPQSLALVLEPQIADELSIAVDGSAVDTHVVGWRRTLSNGFRNGLAGYFRPSPPAGAADLTIDLLRADFNWTTPHARQGAQITYKAQLLDSSGKTLGIVAGTVVSKIGVTAFDDSGAVAASVASAVESLYEELSTSLLRPALPVS
jgi:hypothetical protein